jgi:hypothetical protein
MSTKLKAGTSTSGAVLDADTTGILELQSGSTPTTAITIDASRNVGIGTASPATKLDVSNSNGRNARIGGLQISGTTSTADAGNNFISSGAYWNGTNYTATSTTAVNHQLGNGISIFYTDSGLTAGNTFTATERMRIDASGNVGIGTSNPQSYLHIPATSGLTPQIKLGATSSYQLQVGYNNSAEYGFLQAYAANLSTPDDIVINPSGGNLLVGTTSATGKISVDITGNTYGVFSNNTNTSTTSTYLFWGYTNTGSKFMVYGNGGIANYSANNSNLSDRNVKKDFAPAKPYLDTICAIPVQTFKYIDQEDNELNLGVVAQDVQAVAPELVTESNWGSKDDPKMCLSIYQTDLQYALMKAIQELNAKVDAQATTIAELQARTA